MSPSPDLRELYEARAYPPMSHPSADPAVVAAAARLAGVNVAGPGRARVLEIGCASGHHLIPLALRWPEADFTGIDFSGSAIATARERASETGVTNLRFLQADLRDFAARQSYDFIVAHGFLSWVPDDVKTALFRFIRHHLAPNGVAVVSFNLATGWANRLPLIAKTRVIMAAVNTDEITALTVLREIAGADDKPLIDDMLAKGPEILPFDDFAPVNDPWSLPQFLAAAKTHGLRWLGEADASANLPPGLASGRWAEILSSAPDPLTAQILADTEAARTFRSALLCRADAHVAGGISAAELESFHFRSKDGRAIEADARQIVSSLHAGQVEARIGVTDFDGATPEFPCLDRFRLACARHRLPVVDAWHKSCNFPSTHFALLADMDGSRSIRSLREGAQTHCPDLAFDPWIAHLASRGFFT